MSVLIKGMDMPLCCADCDLHNPFSKTPYCRRLLQVIPLEGRLENCPLVEVPTPHGRLIDACKLFRGSVHKVTDHNPNGEDRFDWYIKDARAFVEEQPTVIESEE